MDNEEKKSDVPELVDELWQFLGQFAKETGAPLPERYKSSDPDTYKKVVDYFKSEVDQGRVLVVVAPLADGRFSFYLQEVEPHKPDHEGNLVDLGMSVERVNEIISREIFTNLHFVYWNTPNALLKWWESSGQTADVLKEKFEMTKPLLSGSLKEKILLARTLAANSLVQSVYEIRWKLIPNADGSFEALCSALVKLTVSGNAPPQTTNMGTSFLFELTRGEIRELIHALEVIEKRMESNLSEIRNRGVE